MILLAFPKVFQRVPRVFHGVSGAFQGFQRYLRGDTEDFGGVHGVLELFKGFQGCFRAVPGGFRCVPVDIKGEFQGLSRGFRDVPGYFKAFQEYSKRSLGVSEWLQALSEKFLGRFWRYRVVLGAFQGCSRGLRRLLKRSRGFHEHTLNPTETPSEFS